MAVLEFIDYAPMVPHVEDGKVRWSVDPVVAAIKGLPQIFWSNGAPWSEANHWALTKSREVSGRDLETLKSLMKHLKAYASWLEVETIDWRHFPMRKEGRAVVRFRKALMAKIEANELAASTAKARMAAAIQFYRHAQRYGFVDQRSVMWHDRSVLVSYHDTLGFERTLLRISSELSIPNKSRSSLRVEDGLTPLSDKDAHSLLHFSKEQGPQELNLMLSLGVLTGARIGTIVTLGVKDIEGAHADPQVPDMYLLRIGPGTTVSTKFDVAGELSVPKFLLDRLKEYAYSEQRLKRQGRASKADRGLLFLTTRARSYETSSVRRLLTDLRRRAVGAGLKFMKSFKFHQTRATYGTWLMQVALKVTSVSAAVAFVKAAMMHAKEATTFLYVRFIEQTKVKVQVANEFTAVFSGVVNRDWKQYGA